jgi:hypothetical protein
MQFITFSCAMCDFSPGNSYLMRYYVRVVWLRVGYGLIYSYLTHPLYPCSWDCRVQLMKQWRHP